MIFDPDVQDTLPQPRVIRWMCGVSRVERRTRMEGMTMVFEHRINGADWQELARVTFEQPEPVGLWRRLLIFGSGFRT